MQITNEFSNLNNIFFSKKIKKKNKKNDTNNPIINSPKNNRESISSKAQKITQNAKNETLKANAILERSYELINEYRTDEFYDDAFIKNYKITFNDNFYDDCTYMTETTKEGIIKRITKFQRNYYPEKITSITEYSDNICTIYKYAFNQIDSIQRNPIGNQKSREIMFFEDEKLSTYFLIQGPTELKYTFNPKTQELETYRIH